MRARLVTRFFIATLAVLAVFCAASLPTQAVTAGPSCGERLETNNRGIAIKILFAKNGAVQRYVVVHSQENVEAANDMRLDLESQFGPADVNAPPLRILSFKPGEGGMMIPDKAVDSCGRTLSFQ
ncbi:MAG TPA: hypothetical protein VNF68_15560 [Candidatus Baltobacteraceae bacterium]|nr:hypothetical protein [Candidatus Baltobacteraceae bacterium]